MEIPFIFPPKIHSDCLLLENSSHAVMITLEWIPLSTTTTGRRAIYCIKAFLVNINNRQINTVCSLILRSARWKTFLIDIEKTVFVTQSLNGIRVRTLISVFFFNVHR